MGRWRREGTEIVSPFFLPSTLFIMGTNQTPSSCFRHSSDFPTYLNSQPPPFFSLFHACYIQTGYSTTIFSGHCCGLWPNKVLTLPFRNGCTTIASKWSDSCMWTMRGMPMRCIVDHFFIYGVINHANAIPRLFRGAHGYEHEFESNWNWK